MAKIFTTGIAGFLGSHLAEALIEQGHEVSGCDNLIGGYEDNVPQGAQFTRADCLDLEKMVELTKGADIVYHTACTAHEGLSVFSPHFITLNTYQITASVASAAIQNKVKRFVNCSSMARYGSQPTLPFTEDMVCNPKDPYGNAKYAAERMLNILSDVHGIEVVHAVPHNIIGPRQKYDDPYRNVASIMINMMLQGKQPIIYGDGEQQRSFSFVQDVVDPLTKMGFAPNVVGEVINIGPDDDLTTINDLSRTLAELLEFDLDPVYMPDRPQEVKRAACSADKARRLLGYEPKTSLRDGLQSMIDYVKARGSKPFEYRLPLEIVNDKTPQTWVKKMF